MAERQAGTSFFKTDRVGEGLFWQKCHVYRVLRGDLGSSVGGIQALVGETVPRPDVHGTLTISAQVRNVAGNDRVRRDG
jgi:hypothetical protein